MPLVINFLGGGWKDWEIQEALEQAVSAAPPSVLAEMRTPGNASKRGWECHPGEGGAIR